MLIDSRKLDLYLKLKYNVLFAGRPGVGKTSIIFDAAQRAGLKVKYFSAPTMDPWVDLVGVPKNVTLPHDGKNIEVLDLIPPKDFIVNKYDIIFIDEFNRAPPKVTNALMELMQFKTINGRRLDINMVWAAINPFTEEGEFHVEKLDPAVEDRFQIRIDLPYSVDKQHLKKKHGPIADVFTDWSNDQPNEVKFALSPRRLDESIGFYEAGGTLSEMLKHGNIAGLESKIKSVADSIAFHKAIEEKNEPVLRKILSRNISTSIEAIIKDKKANNFEKVFEYLPEEWISSQVLAYKKDSYIFDQVQKMSTSGNTRASSILQEICKTNMNSHFVISNFSKINHVIPKEALDKIEEKKKEVEKNRALFLSNETLLSKSASDSELMKKFIPDINVINNFTSTNLNNFYKQQNFNEIFEKFNSLKATNELTLSENQDKFKSRLAFSIAISLLISDAMGSAGTVYERLKTVLRKGSHPTSSYIFNKNMAKNNFEDMEDKIEDYQENIKKILPNNLNSEDLVKIFLFATSTRTRSNMQDPFTPIVKTSSTVKKPKKF